MARSGIAIVGMAGQFLESHTVEAFWRNLRDGRECVGRNARVETRPGADESGHWVELIPPNDRDEYFDAAFFGLSPREAERLEPQHRGFLEIAWEALEDGGYVPAVAGPRVGVFAGANFTSYFALGAERHLPEALDEMVGADKDYLATRAAHHLGLQGPAITVQTACSTSLVATHLACRSLQAGECDAALAGGVSMTRPRLTRYYYTPGGLLSPDGYCRAFDAEARGTVFTEGLGVVLLMRLEDALRRGHPIYAVIRGSAVNNDGGGKASYMAPSITGQERVLREAYRDAGVDPGAVGYIEAHGTATVLGDAIELAALTRVFRDHAPRPGACQIGSVKTNIGHTASAAGVAGLMKAALALRHGLIPPNVNFETPNPDLNAVTSPFAVTAQAQEWPDRPGERRFAGVSSFGVGGTNAHVVLEGPPRRPAGRVRRPYSVLTLSARSDAALAAAAGQVEHRLRGASRRELADVAYTLNAGRAAFDHRAAVVCRDVREARRQLQGRAQSAAVSGRVPGGKRSIAFMFPGQGAQFAGMGRGLYAREPAFRETIDACLDGLAAAGGPDLAPLFRGAAAGIDVTETRIAQPLLFTVEYALAQLLIGWGVSPGCAIGHSVGEYAAACVAGVFPLQDALRLVAARGALMQAQPPGAMLSVAATAEAVLERAPEGLDLAAVNSPRQCVVSGPAPLIDAFAEDLVRAQIHATRLRTSHAFHSRMMEPMLEAFGAVAGAVEAVGPKMAYISNVTGESALWTDLKRPDYWTRQIRQPVLFAQGVQSLLARGVDLLVEVGPGRQLSSLAQQNGAHRQGVRIINTMAGEAAEADAESETLMRALARLWTEGASVDWLAAHAPERRRMVALPSYPFERRRYRTTPLEPGAVHPKVKDDIGRWRWLPSWRRLELVPDAAGLDPGECWLVFDGEAHLGPHLAQRLAVRGERVVRVRAGQAAGEDADGTWVIDPADPHGAIAVFRALEAQGLKPRRIVHAWGVERAAPAAEDRALFEARQGRGLYSLTRILHGYRRVFGSAPVTFDIVTSGAHNVTGEEALRPGVATALGFARVAPQEQLNVKCRVIDLDPALVGEDAAAAADEAARAVASGFDQTAALRRRYWWTQGVVRSETPPDRARGPRLKRGGTYLITGGLGHIGLILARHLAEHWAARLVLVGRSAIEAQPGEAPDEPAAQARAARRDAIAELEALGAEVRYLRADIADHDQVAALRTAAHAAFGPPDGLILGAGTVESPTHIDDVDDMTSYEDNFLAKVHGLKTILSVFGEDRLDFAMALSSISTVLGGLGHCAYAAANHACDLLVLQHRRTHPSAWMTADWDLWVGGHLSVEGARMYGQMMPLAILPAEGAQAFEDLLSAPDTEQVIVSTHDLAWRVDAWVKGVGVGGGAPQTRHERPNLATTYAEAEGELEQQLAEIWGLVLGIDKVGRDDDFFEMGGHSLLAVQIALQIQAILPPDAPYPNLYETPTIRSLVESVQGAGAADPFAAQAAAI